MFLVVLLMFLVVLLMFLVILFVFGCIVNVFGCIVNVLGCIVNVFGCIVIVFFVELSLYCCPSCSVVLDIFNFVIFVEVESHNFPLTFCVCKRAQNLFDRWLYPGGTRRETLQHFYRNNRENILKVQLKNSRNDVETSAKVLFFQYSCV